MPSSFCSRSGCSCTFRSLTVCCSSRWRTSCWCSHFREASHESVLRIFRRRPASVADAPGISLSPSCTWFGTRVPCGMFPGIKTPGYSQDNPPGQGNGSMKEQLPSPEFNSGQYERPNQNWICGKAAEGKPCRIGPNAKGRCRAACECQPALEIKAGETKGRYRCTRSTEYGGPCETG